MARIRGLRAVEAVACVLVAVAAVGCAGVAGEAREATLIDAAVARLVAAERTLGGRLGIVVLDGANGAVLASHQAEQGFLPASNLKVLTAAIALESLGPDHRFVTELHRTGEVQDGVLHGDLILRGQGDPALGTEASGDPGLERFVAAVRGAGVQRLTGRVVGDGSWLGGEHLGHGWQWDHLQEGFAAPFGGLCCGGNLENGIPVRDPAAFAASVLARALGAGFAAAAAPPAEQPSPGSSTVRSLGRRLVCSHESAPLGTLLVHMLGDSDNLYAEQMWRTAARVAGGEAGDGSTAAAAAHGRKTLMRLGVDTTGLVQEDGCGLSRRNLVRPTHVAGALLAMQRSPHRSAFHDALPLAGRTGTLRERFQDGPAHARVRAKTGTLTRATCLSGYVPRTDPQVPPFVFSVLWNDCTEPDAAAIAAIDAFVQELAAIAVRT